MRFSIQVALAVTLLNTADASSLYRRNRFNSASNNTADTSHLKTWWHATGEVNTGTPVQDGNVRQSHLYSVQVASSISHNLSTFYDSFAYESIPGNGMGTDNASGVGTTMAWSSFLYGSDATVKISRSDNWSIGNYTIRPTNLNLNSTTYGGDVYISIPYNPRGYRFSVEFGDDLQTISGPEEKSPWNSLLIFASPMEDPSIIPSSSSSSSLVVQEGLISGLDSTQASAVIFKPGVYYCTGYSHMKLSSSVNWVYFAPGAYVKGAVEFSNTGSEVKATGHGVLSGEQYVWYADPDSNYTTGSDNNGLRMWSGQTGSSQQTFTLNGPTVNTPPFNSMDWNGDLTLMTTVATDYKQVGSFYAQTDGLEFYPGSQARDIFYHVNDDTIKTYYSNINIDGVVVWKYATAPVVQFGWASRELSNITINDVSVIHQSYDNAGDNPGLIGSDNAYTASTTGISSNHSTANVSNTMQDITWSNFRAEGPSACLFRICALENLRNVTISNAWIEKFASSDLNTTESLLPVFYDSITGAQVNVSNFVIDNFVVGSTKVTADNAGSVGQIDVDSAYASAVRYQ
ncbi:lypothetical protein [Talaromyces proteolyticus]|uniref:Lypothetical protein n=1 Tax=Talaromyces proteolyticus TaxID=1131652 RepID=A0AAD4KHF2_9EURO|nr:lypothetical protein [Talaromyces proteolyticus]KAH8692224.1 lypothetical protein [Talaromyces proteolyticus]